MTPGSQGSTLGRLGGNPPPPPGPPFSGAGGGGGRGPRPPGGRAPGPPVRRSLLRCGGRGRGRLLPSGWRFSGLRRPPPRLPLVGQDRPDQVAAEGGGGAGAEAVRQAPSGRDPALDVVGPPDRD